MQLVRKYALHQPEEWGALFHRILQSRIRDWSRRSRVRNRWRVWFSPGSSDNATASLDEVADNHNPGPAEQANNAQALSALETALRRLPPRQQQAFLLRVWEDMDVREAARTMGCSEGSVKTHFSRAIHALREILEEYR